MDGRGLAPLSWGTAIELQPVVSRWECRLCTTKSSDARNLGFYVKSSDFQMLGTN